MTNKEPKFTPGSWRLMRRVPTAIESEAGRFIATAGSYSDGSEQANLENEANAKLISASPDLLEALQKAIPLIHYFYNMDKANADIYDQAEQAIQKALTL